MFKTKPAAKTEEVEIRNKERMAIKSLSIRSSISKVESRMQAWPHVAKALRGVVGWDRERSIMIGYLKGVMLEKKQAEVWLDVNGVGYRVKYQGPKSKNQTGDKLALYIHTAVREDAITLYGFETMKELEIFELLLTVSGVGPKTAMVIVGTQKVERIEKAIREADVQFFQQVPGIGKKSAQRIIVDLKSKIGSLKELDLQSEEGENDDVTLALKQFGFKAEEIRQVMKQIDLTLSDQEKVREGLKRLGKIR